MPVVLTEGLNYAGCPYRRTELCWLSLQKDWTMPAVLTEGLKYGGCPCRRTEICRLSLQKDWTMPAVLWLYMPVDWAKTVWWNKAETACFQHDPIARPRCAKNVLRLIWSAVLTQRLRQSGSQLYLASTVCVPLGNNWTLNTENCAKV